MTGEGYQFLQREQIHRHPPFPAAMLPNVCSTFAICIWASAFAGGSELWLRMEKAFAG